MSARWFHYAGVNEALGGCWQGMTLGPATADPVPALDIQGVSYPLLGTWDHEPTVQDIDAVTPWDWRTICPACGLEYCDDEKHSEAVWTVANERSATSAEKLSTATRGGYEKATEGGE